MRDALLQPFFFYCGFVGLVDDVEGHLDGARAANGVADSAEGRGADLGLNVQGVEVPLLVGGTAQHLPEGGSRR